MSIGGFTPRATTPNSPYSLRGTSINEEGNESESTIDRKVSDLGKIDETLTSEKVVFEKETQANYVQSEEEKTSALTSDEEEKNWRHKNKSTTTRGNDSNDYDYDETDEVNSQSSGTISADVSTAFSLTETSDTEPVLLKVSQVIGVTLTNVSTDADLMLIVK